jgi:transposase-like protein
MDNVSDAANRHLHSDPADRLVDAQGRTAAEKATAACPNCGAPATKRVASSGFGHPHPLCSVCGHAFTDERWVAP